MTTEPTLFDFLIDDCSSDVEVDEVDVTSDLIKPEGDEYDVSQVEVRRSKRRKKSSEAYRRDGKIIVVVPWRLTQREITATVNELVDKLKQIELRHVSTQSLHERAQYLVNEYLDQDVISNHSVPVIIRWVTNQNSRWGSCTPSTGTIRLSHRLQKMPLYVQDAVLLHELIHLIVLGHNQEFHALMNRYPDLAKARAFLDGYTLGMHHS